MDDKSKIRIGRVATKAPTKRTLSPFDFVFLTIAAILIPFILSLMLALLAKSLHISLDLLKTNVGSSVFAIVSEALYLVIVIWCLRRRHVSWGSLGFKKIKPLRALIYIVAGAGWYLLLTLGFTLLVKYLFPNFNSSQEQDIGIQNLQGNLQMIIAYISLAIVPPIAEETLFRGFLFKGLRRRWGFWLSTLVTSLLFALAHMQLNVGVDVFALSIVLCYIVEKTGSIIPGMIIHSLKNTLAFVLLFTHLFPMIH